MPKPILYWNKVCPFVHRAWITAVEKAVDVELVHIDLGPNKPEWYTKEINPAGTVPTLRTEDGKLVFESLYIAQYLDETYGEKGALQPGDALAKYKLRLFIKEAGDSIGPLYGLLRSASGPDAAAARADATKALDAWEAAYAASSDGPYFLGNTFSLADIHILPFLDRFRHTLKAYQDFDIFAGHPRLARLVKEASLRPSFVQTSQPGSFYISKFRPYAKGEPATPKWKLYSSPVCPFCDIARIAANLKKADLEVVEIDLQNPPEWYLSINPKGEVPSLELAPGSVIRESQLVAQFLDEAIADGATLIPQDPQALADTRYWLNSVGEALGDYYTAAYGSGAEKTAAQKSIVDDLTFLEGVLSKQAVGPFFLGSQPSLADVASVPHLSRIDALYRQLPELKAFDAAYPRINTLLSAARDAEGFKTVIHPAASYASALAK